jgi:hypothetical protein
MNQQTQMIIGVIARHSIGAIGGGLVAQGLVTTDQLNTVAGSVVVLISVAWSYWQKRKTAA